MKNISLVGNSTKVANLKELEKTLREESHGFDLFCKRTEEAMENIEKVFAEQKEKEKISKREVYFKKVNSLRKEFISLKRELPKCNSSKQLIDAYFNSTNIEVQAGLIKKAKEIVKSHKSNVNFKNKVVEAYDTIGDVSHFNNFEKRKVLVNNTKVTEKEVKEALDSLLF